MKLSRLLSWFALSGAVSAIVLRVIWGWVNTHAWLSTSAKIALQKVTVIVWPSSVFMLAATNDQAMAIKLFGISLLVNVALYMLIGALAWLGLNKHISFLAVLVLSLTAIWFRLLTM